MKFHGVDQPTSNMSDQVEIYKKFIKNYCIALVPLSLFGLYSFNDQFSIFYTLYLIVWGILLKNYWFNFKLPSITNVDHNSRKITNKKVFFKNLVIIPMILVALLVGQIFTLFLEVVLTQVIQIDSFVLKTVISLVPTILTTVLVKLTTIIFDKAIDPKIDYIITIWSSFTPLLLTLFVYLPLGYQLNFNDHLLNIQNRVQKSYLYNNNMKIITNDFKINEQRFIDQYKYFIITNQIVSLALENLLPKILNKNLKHIEPLDLNLGYLKYIMNFGFIVVFSNIWSLSPAISMLFILINFYIDGYKIKKGKVVNNPSNDFNFLVKTMYKIVTLFTVLSSIVQPALILMYRYSNIPGVGLADNNSNNWFKTSPVNINYSLVVAVAFGVEHLCFGLDKVTKKLSITKLSKVTNTKLMEDSENVQPQEAFDGTAVTSSYKPKQPETDDMNQSMTEIRKPLVEAKEHPVEATRPVAENSPVNNNEAHTPVTTQQSPEKTIKPMKYDNVIPGDILADVTGDDPDLSNGATLPDVLPISTATKKPGLSTNEPMQPTSVVEPHVSTQHKDSDCKHPVLNDIVPQTSPAKAADAALNHPTQATVRQHTHTKKNMGIEQPKQNTSYNISSKVISEPARSLRKKHSHESMFSKIKDKKKKKKMFGLKI